LLGLCRAPGRAPRLDTAPPILHLTNSAARPPAATRAGVSSFSARVASIAPPPFLAIRMARTSEPRCRLYYNEMMMKHTHEWPHIEKCTRASSAYDHLSQAGLISQCEELPGRAATDAELLTAHSQNHLDEVAAITQAVVADPTNRRLRGESLGPTTCAPPPTSHLGLSLSDHSHRMLPLEPHSHWSLTPTGASLPLEASLAAEPDGPGGVYYSPEAEASARLACGCVIDAALDVLEAARAAPPERPVAFALVRPPGHHAGADDTPGHCAEGFCFFNSVAVAAGCALERGAQRVAILDWDVHHGNGTQKIFYNDARVLYVSLHRYGDRWCVPFAQGPAAYWPDPNPNPNPSPNPRLVRPLCT
jgi:acetoin utilization deacetylase AcuC-like enzyme